MLILYCGFPLDHAKVDPDYVDEKAAAEAVGHDSAVIDFEALLDGDVDSAVRRVTAQSTSTPALYRGWMMPVDRYTLLFNSLAARNVDLITSPGAYRHCHYLPENYPDIREHTPSTVWRHSSEGLDIDGIMQTVAQLLHGPAILKDYVKSRKHEWADACFIADIRDRDEVERVTSNFIKGQGKDLAEGLVFREYIPLATIGIDPRTNAPVCVEYRLFYFNGSRIAAAPHFDSDAVDGHSHPDLDRFDAVAASIPSPFFSMDIAKTASGDWIIIELGDGQVAGLPESIDLNSFYASIA